MKVPVIFLSLEQKFDADDGLETTLRKAQKIFAIVKVKFSFYLFHFNKTNKIDSKISVRL